MSAASASAAPRPASSALAGLSRRLRRTPDGSLLAAARRADQLEPEHGRPKQSTSRATGERAACATIPTAVVDMARSVVFDVHPLSSTAHTARDPKQSFLAAGRGPVRDAQRRTRRPSRSVRAARKPLAVQQHLTEIDPRVQDLAHESSSFTPVTSRDLALARTLGLASKDATHHGAMSFGTSSPSTRS